MSIALLRAKGFKQRLQDDMESVYYVLMYASILWLPRNEDKDFLRTVSQYFDQHSDCNGTTEGGVMKAGNILTGNFQRAWRFDNVHLQSCLDDILELLRPIEEQPNWKPEELYAILTSADEEDLPLDDRMDHYQILQDKITQRKAQYEQCEREDQSETLSVESVPGLSTSAQTSSSNSEVSSKRSVDEAGLEECEEPTKRMCCTIFEDGHQDQRIVTTNSQYLHV